MSDVAETQQPVSTGVQQKGAPLFKPGQSGNPKGRPKGSRNKLGQAFIEALYDDFQTHGANVIVKVRTDDPVQYLKVVAGILPQKIEIERFDNMSEDERSSRIRELAEQLGLALGITGGASRSDGGAEAPSRPDEALSVQTLQ